MNPKNSVQSSVPYLYWVRKENEVVDLDWSSIIVISRLYAHNDWKEIEKALEDHFEATFSLLTLL